VGVADDGAEWGLGDHTPAPAVCTAQPAAVPVPPHTGTSTARRDDVRAYAAGAGTVIVSLSDHVATRVGGVPRVCLPVLMSRLCMWCVGAVAAVAAMESFTAQQDLIALQQQEILQLQRTVRRLESLVQTLFQVVAPMSTAVSYERAVHDFERGTVLVCPAACSPCDCVSSSCWLWCCRRCVSVLSASPSSAPSVPLWRSMTTPAAVTELAPAARSEGVPPVSTVASGTARDGERGAAARTAAARADSASRPPAAATAVTSATANGDGVHADGSADDDGLDSSGHDGGVATQRTQTVVLGSSWIPAGFQEKWARQWAVAESQSGGSYDDGGWDSDAGSVDDAAHAADNDHVVADAVVREGSAVSAAVRAPAPAPAPVARPSYVPETSVARMVRDELGDLLQSDGGVTDAVVRGDASPVRGTASPPAEEFTAAYGDDVGAGDSDLDGGGDSDSDAEGSGDDLASDDDTDSLGTGLDDTSVSANRLCACSHCGVVRTFAIIDVSRSLSLASKTCTCAALGTAWRLDEELEPLQVTAVVVAEENNNSVRPLHGHVLYGGRFNALQAEHAVHAV
jgi:hypothetical protein